MSRIQRTHLSPKQRLAKKAQLAALMAAATKYEIAKREIAQYEKDKKVSKRLLLGWLGDDESKTLPDGRIVRKSTIDYDAELLPRAAHSATSLVIEHPAPVKAK